jgi:hypothetical protein
MALRAVEALPHPAIITDENFFSHVNLVSTSRCSVCQVLFSTACLLVALPKARDVEGRWPKKSFFAGKKLARPMAVPTMRLESEPSAFLL